MENETEYQRQIAESLIRSLGIDEAVYFALQNHWDGVLAHMPRSVPSRRAAPRVRHIRADYKAI
jgi:hypothetical protein